uniref:Uncharacterized protein n=1 Tax=Chlamydomonas leiostraca TaxID=1034604 RepID=A0A7S0S0Y6_9CHLO
MPLLQGPTLARSTSSNDGSRGAAGAGAGAKPKWAAISPQASTGFSLRRSTSSSSSSAANAGGAQPRVPPALRGQVPAFNVIHHQVMSKAGDRPGPPAANPTATVATDAAGAVS